jgi:hypothetical protein
VSNTRAMSTTVGSDPNTGTPPPSSKVEFDIQGPRSRHDIFFSLTPLGGKDEATTDCACALIGTMSYGAKRMVRLALIINYR